MKIMTPTNSERCEPNGKMKIGGGAIVTEGGISASSIGGGCGMGNCSCSPGHWVLIMQPRDEKTERVKSVLIRFDDRAELEAFRKSISEIEVAP
jgi:hypothetical protein